MKYKINWFVMMFEAPVILGFAASFIGKMMNSVGYYSDVAFAEAYFNVFSIVFGLMLLINYEFKVSPIEVRDA